jgi:hypothetical protein
MISSSKRPAIERLNRFNYLAVFAVLLATGPVVSAQVLQSISSVSGQFTVTAAPQYSPLLHRGDLAADTNYVRLEPALLAVSAERFKLALRTQLGFKPADNWAGKIFLVLHPAQTAADPVNIAITRLPDGWSYRVELPDVVLRPRFARALAATLLLEIANRGNLNENSAELPPWLADGLAQQILGGETTKLILSAPGKKNELDVTEARFEKNSRGLDPLAGARATLQNFPVLAFDQLCWPADEQLNGADGGAYFASAQLFTADLLALPGGPEKMRRLLAGLPAHLNWQTAFYDVFRENFRRALDVEKWWSLRVVRFASRDPGPRWTAAASRERLAELLAVPVEFRNAPDALPEFTQVSLQTAVQNFSAAQRQSVLGFKLRDFELAQFRMAPPFAALVDGYRTALADFLAIKSASAGGKNSAPARRGASLTATVKKLDALDARRRAIEEKMDASPLPQTQRRP